MAHRKSHRGDSQRGRRLVVRLLPDTEARHQFAELLQVEGQVRRVGCLGAKADQGAKGAARGV